MPINIEVGGVEYTNFISASVNIALDTLANDFSFEAASPEDMFLPFKGGESCKIIVDGVLVLTGFIEQVAGSYSGVAHGLSISGRDRTSDLIDSSIGALNDIRSGITLKELIEKVVEHIGSDLKVIDNANPDPFNAAEDIASPSPGDNAFGFVESYAQKRQVLLTSNADGDIVITNSEPVRSTGFIQHDVNSDDNNVINASWTFSNNDLYNTYIQLGQQDPVALSISGSKTEEGIISQDSIETDSDIRKGRQIVAVADKGFSKEQLLKRAQWSKKIRLARSTVYSATVHGFKDDEGNLWQINQLVSIVDVFADINRNQLINTISFTYSSAGSITTIGFVAADSYALLLSEPKPIGTDQSAFKS